jgi:Pre-mRNA-splicing factor SF3A3, of SF3a complex, Prp9
MAKRQDQLADIYEDKDDSRRDALQKLAMNGPELFALVSEESLLWSFGTRVVVVVVHSLNSFLRVCGSVCVCVFFFFFFFSAVFSNCLSLSLSVLCIFYLSPHFTSLLCSSFADQVREIKNYHRQHPTAPLVEEAFAVTEPKVAFTGEENNGRCVDLHAFYSRFLNLTYGKKYYARDEHTGESPLSYIKYLESFFKFGDDLSAKDAPYMKYVGDVYTLFTRALAHHALTLALSLALSLSLVCRYLEDLWDYLRGFVERTQPMHPINDEIDDHIKTFNSLWESGDFQWDRQPVSVPDGCEFCPICRFLVFSGGFLSFLVSLCCESLFELLSCALFRVSFDLSSQPLGNRS